MIPIPRASFPVEPPKIKLVGVGGAGCSALDRIVLDGGSHIELVAMNTDVQALTSSMAHTKLQLGQEITRGLGTGGDPELGYTAAEQAAEEIEQLIGESKMVFILAGLGGGTGSGAAPVVARAAREKGALTLVIATLPFTFEGKRRAQQAQESLAALEQWADAVICFDNDRMGDSVAPSAGIHQAFVAADNTISQCVRSLIELLTKPGLIHAGFDDILAVLRNQNARCLFGYGESHAENRSNEALDLALRNPLMDKGRMLAEASSVLVHVIGGNSMTLYEVQIVMEELGRHVDDQTRILFGATVDPKMANRLSVTVLSSVNGSGTKRLLPAVMDADRLAGAHRAAGASAPSRIEAPEPSAALVLSSEEPAGEEAEAEDLPLLAAIEPAHVPEPVAQVHVSAPQPDAAIQPAPAAAAPVHYPHKPRAPREEKPPTAKQESLPFESATRGRFEKSEPTIIDGQDLDVPTFLRKNVRIR